MSSSPDTTGQRPQAIPSSPTHCPAPLREYAPLGLGNAPKRKSILFSPRSVVLSLLWRHEWVFGLLPECRSLLHRIATLLRLRTRALGDLGPSAGLDSSGHLVPCSRT